VGVNGSDALRADGYRFVVPAPTQPDDFDRQGHFNNAAIVRCFNDVRVAYVHDAVGPWWPGEIAARRYLVVARELHVLYESEGRPGESFVAAMRYARRDGKAAIVEHRLVEAASARAIARAWIVQLLVQDGAVVEWPASYLARVAEIEGAPLEVRPRATREPWGPPA
jgi:acyl-CoA thioesterase FadM